MRKKLGEILVETGAASEADVDEALRDQNAGEPNRLGDLLLANGKISAHQLARALSQQHGLPFVELPALPQAVLDLVPLELQRQYRFVPLEQKDTELSIAMADLSNLEVIAELEKTWTKIHVSVASGDEIDALHATLSGLFVAPAPLVSAPGLAEDLFGTFDLEPEAPSAPSPVPVIAPVGAPRPSPAASPRVEDLFGDLNLESARTGISAQPPEEGAPSELSGPVVTGEVIGAALVVSAEPDDPALEVAAEPAENSGPIVGAREGTGPVVDTPFFREVSVGALVPSQPLPFSSQSSVVPVSSAPVESSPSTPGQPLPDWLKSDTAVSSAGSSWTGALDHLAPSKLVVGLTRALLARGLVTEAEILAALGQKK